jgi:hypothetical protein
MSPVTLNERLVANRFTVPPLLLEATSSSAGNGRACAPVTVLPLHPFTEGRSEALLGISVDVRSCRATA